MVVNGVTLRVVEDQVACSDLRLKVGSSDTVLYLGSHGRKALIEGSDVEQPEVPRCEVVGV